MTEWSKHTGKKKYHLTLIYELPDGKYRCSCSCGKFVTHAYRDIMSGRASSCGCLPSISKKSRWFSEIFVTHGLSGTSEYQAWQTMKTRCTNPKATGYEHYGGRGIKICDEWINCFENFIEDMGMKPEPSLSLDRIDVNGNYEKSNCRWATWEVQANNKRGNNGSSK